MLPRTLTPAQVQQLLDACTRRREELELAEIMAVPAAVGEALVAVALTEDGENAARLLQAVTVLEDSPRILARTRGLLELGAALRRQGQRSAAQPFLRRALDLADRHGATLLADRGRIELEASGAALGAPHSPARTR